MHHFITFCSRFIAYSNDNEGNPFQMQLFPKASSSPALLHAMAALAAGHLSRTQKQHEIPATNHYTLALRELNSSLSDPVVARSDQTLGACLLLCVFEISNSDNSLWLEHLQGARDLILFRGGPKTSDYLTRMFSFLDISGSLSSGGGPLLEGNYWLNNDLNEEQDDKTQLAGWPYYDTDHTMVNHFHELMVYMAKLSRLSAESMSDIGSQHPEMIAEKAAQIHSELMTWWSACPEKLRNQSNDWRRQLRPRKLTVPETLEEEAFSSVRSCVQACVIYLNHILDPMGREPQKQEVIDAISDILAIAQETPEGYGLEMGQYWGLFMAGIAVFNDEVAEDLIRRKLKADTSVSIYHADRPHDLLEILWKRQHQYGTKYDWRQVQIQMGIQIPSTGTVLLTGGTGKISSRIAPLLSANGNDVLIASRSGNSPELASCKGVKFDWLDESTYKTAFECASISAIFLVAPPIMDCLPPMKTFIDLAIKNGVKRFVLLSASVLEDGDGPIMTAVASYIKGLKVEYAILQPTWFMENFSEVQHLPTIRDQDQIITATGQGKVPFVRAEDIAAVAFRALTEEVPHNKDHLILGPRLWSYDEVAALLTQKLGRKISHLKISEAEFAQGIANFMPEDYAKMLAKLETVIKNGGEERLNDVVSKVTGREPKRFEDFVDEMVGKGVWDKSSEE
ncbi:NAD(P)-binding protein [Mollisia scopiformis]|uniref:NAD(P)-binding protein n=1 Tax=Mollisia scopiformis TaxID=149040 RepID=A0A194XLE1_MOLSC|nr:NAD(P)-binding protein [Mollisia scopiformis]KUJ20904.1 NAD(P)-binding protein [Mollisia scopiformis]